jgi:hypothetical protein
LEQNFPLAGLPQEAHVAAPSGADGETGEAMQKATRPLPSRQRASTRVASAWFGDFFDRFTRPIHVARFAEHVGLRHDADE